MSQQPKPDPIVDAHGETFVSLEQRATLALFRTAAEFDHELTDILRNAGVTLPQYNVLRVLRGAQGKALCRSEVGSKLINPVPDVTRLLDRLEEAGLVERKRTTEDKRYVTTEITEKGLELLARLDGPINEAHKTQLGHLTAAELEQLTSLLERARERC